MCAADQSIISVADPEFHRGGAPTLEEGANLLFGPFSPKTAFMKMKKSLGRWGGGGGDAFRALP